VGRGAQLRRRPDESRARDLPFDANVGSVRSSVSSPASTRARVRSNHQPPRPPFAAWIHTPLLFGCAVRSGALTGIDDLAHNLGAGGVRADVRLRERLPESFQAVLLVAPDVRAIRLARAPETPTGQRGVARHLWCVTEDRQATRGAPRELLFAYRFPFVRPRSVSSRIGVGGRSGTSRTPLSVRGEFRVAA
jgi:hypothetical protein